ncbi:MAG: M56 family metallopeptidase [Planctomycetaceae bacterium]|nr:M56 family metallopeptidase [Planctomycetaceae bacterium]
MTTYDFLLLLGVKTLMLSVAALVAFAVLQLTRCCTPKIHRLTWSAVLLLGVFGAGIPLRLPMIQTPDNISVAVDDANVSVTGFVSVDTYPDEGRIPAGMQRDHNGMLSTGRGNPDGLPSRLDSDLDSGLHSDLHSDLHSAEQQSPVAESGDVATIETITLEPPPETVAPSRFDVAFCATLICAAWLLGIVAILIRRLMLHLVLIRALCSASEAGGAFADEWQQLLAGHDIAPGRLPLLLTDHIGPGLVWRWRSAAVLVPRDLWDEATPEMRDGILRHELAHYRNCDLLRSAIARMMAVAHWFNPVSWFVLHKMDEAIEWLSDLTAFGASRDGATRFAKSLVAVHETAQTISLGRHEFGSGGLNRRISQLQTHLDNQGDSKMKKTAIGILLTLLVTAGLFQVRFVPAAAEEKFAEPQPVADHDPPVQNADDQTEQQGITVTLTDPQGNPASTGYVRNYPHPQPADWEGDQPRNITLEGGKCFVPLSNFDNLESFKMVIYADGFCPYEVSWNTGTEKIPTGFAMALDPEAATIGGIVINEQGEPVADAELQTSVDLSGRQSPRSMIPSYAQWFKTDANGRWIWKTLPKDQLGRDMNLSIEHPDYPRLRIAEGLKYKDFLEDENGDYSKTMILFSGLPLKGKVVDAQGKPVEGVLVYTDAAKWDERGNRNYGTTRTDANGEFLFENCSPNGELNRIEIGVCPKDFAPQFTSLAQLTADMKPVVFTLKPGKKLTIRAMDKEGQPIEGLSVVPRRWNNRSFFKFFDNDVNDVIDLAKTDANGLFVWNNAPEGEFVFEVSGWGRKDYQNHELKSAQLKFGDEENVFTFKPLIHATGNVTDAETGEPIPAFEVTEWFTFKSGSGLTREFGSQPAKDGKFTRTVGHRFGEFDHYYLRVDAPGYEGMMSEDISPDAENLTLNYPLKKATEFSDDLTGIVLFPDGKPANNVIVGVSTVGRPLQTRNGFLLNHFLSGFDNRTVKTDAEGKFKISKHSFSIGEQDYMLFFQHDAGTVSLSKEEFENHTGPITLQPWGSIEGTIYVGTKPGKNLPVVPMPDHERDFMRKAYVSHFYTEVSADENGHYVIGRIVPGTGRIGRAVKFNMGTLASTHAKEYDLKPGETLHIDLGGGGYSMSGKIIVPEDYRQTVEGPTTTIHTDDYLQTIDWRFAHVAARPFVSDQLPFPAEIRQFSNMIDASVPAETLKTIRDSNSNPDEIEKAINELPEVRELHAKYPELAEKSKQHSAFMKEWIAKFNSRYDKQILCTVGDKGVFQIDGMTPGDWTLEIELNIPKVPEQYWDFEETWRKQVNITVLDLPGGPGDEPLELQQPILLGFDPAERQKPSR